MECQFDMLGPHFLNKIVHDNGSMPGILFTSGIYSLKQIAYDVAQNGGFSLQVFVCGIPICCENRSTTEALRKLARYVSLQ